MPILFTGTPQSDLDLTVIIPVAGDITSASRFGDKVETTLNNQATLAQRIAAGPVIGDGTIDADKLASDSVITIKVKDGNITRPKIADGAINADKIQSGVIGINRLDFTNMPTAGQHIAAGPNNDFTAVNAPINVITAGSLSQSLLNLSLIHI